LGDPEITDNEDDDEDWVDVMDVPDSLNPGLLPRPPRYDSDGCPFVAVVDVSGIHHLPVQQCSCDKADPRLDICYLEMGLFPTSFERIQTAFTIKVLEDYRLSNLECKTSAYQYYQKLRRLTSPAFPKAILNRYRELRRLSREYRNVKLWKMHGRAHDQPEGVGRPSPAANAETGAEANMDLNGMNVDNNLMGAHAPSLADNTPRATLASFCPACPQPGVNLPDDWKEEPRKYECFPLPAHLYDKLVSENYSSGWVLWMGISRQITFYQRTRKTMFS
jgi:hypothetical protein